MITVTYNQPPPKRPLWQRALMRLGVRFAPRLFQFSCYVIDGGSAGSRVETMNVRETCWPPSMALAGDGPFSVHGKTLIEVRA